MQSSPSKGKTVAIIQSNYIPWKGYFDIINSVDEFIFLDDAQFTKRDWRNRNKIKTSQGLLWLTIPVITKGLYGQSIDQTEIAEAWTEGHWRSIEMNYLKACHFEQMAAPIKSLYDRVAEEKFLSRANFILIAGICAVLGIDTKISWSRDYPVVGLKTDRLLSICRAAGASHYLSGPSAASYMEIDKFEAAGISISYFDYLGYSEYPQVYGPFEHQVSIIDLIFNTGPAARSYMKSFAR